MHASILFIAGLLGSMLVSSLVSLAGRLSVTTADRDQSIPAYSTSTRGPIAPAYDTSIASDLEKDVRILCWIMTSPQTLYTKAIHVKNTWGRRCNVLLFVSSISDPLFPAIAVEADEGREHLTAKTMHAFKYIFDNHINNADWFIKADDDTYVILENLRYMVADKNPNDPVYFGHHFGIIVQPQGYHSGGAGYVLSRAALRLFGEKGFHNDNLCSEDGGAEDVEIGRCLQKLGVRVMPSLDSLGRSRFHCLNPASHIFGHYPDWYYKYDSHGAKHGIEHMSEFAVTFHYVNPQEMANVEYFVYNFKAYGQSNLPPFPRLNEYYRLRTANDSLLV